MADRDLNFNALVPELLCRDVVASVGFYCDVLGFQKLYGRSDPPFAYLEREGSQIMLDQIEPDGWLTAPLDLPYGRGINLQIETADLTPLLDALAAGDYPLFRQPEEAWYAGADRAYGQRQFLVQDLDGYLLRFCQDLGERALNDPPPNGRIVS
jgi:catechol 2,3-dioxygenase-like lactoylglutathione lyase family enzyme